MMKDLVKYEFNNPLLLEDSEIEEILKVAENLSSWAKDVQEYALNKAIQDDKKWEGFNLVEGRGKRQYSNEDLVIEALMAAGYQDFYKKQLIPITEMEKLLGKKKFKEILGDLITKKQGKLKLVENREEINYG